MEDDLRLKMTFDGRQPSMEDDNKDDLKNKEDLHIAGRHTALDIFRFAVFFYVCSMFMSVCVCACVYVRVFTCV